MIGISGFAAVVNTLGHMLSYPFYQHAFLAGTVVSITAGIVGYFVLLRRLAFAAHALSHVGFAGAAGAVLTGLAAVDGLLIFTIAGAAAIGLLGERLRGRDATIGTVLALTLGLGALFMSLYSGNATEAYALLFGEILGISGSSIVVTIIAAAIALLILGVLCRPLLYCSIDEEGAFVAGLPVRMIGVAFMVVLAIAVSAAAQVVGALLIFTLLVTPAAIADRFTARPALAMFIACAFAVAFTWSGLIVAYVVPFPVSFFITAFAFVAFVVVRRPPPRRRQLDVSMRSMLPSLARTHRKPSS